MQSFDTTTGARLSSFIGSGSNGRGVVVVGDIVYTTDAGSGNVGRFDRVTGANLGGGFTIPGASGISTITFDGDNFWTSDYTGTNKAFLVSPAGVVLKTITLSESLGFYDGLEYFNGMLIANRFDGGIGGGNQYSVYDLDGNLLIKDFIDTTGHGNGTGIAFDGTNFYISDIFNGRATIWSGVDGSFLGALTLLDTANVIEDLSFDFEARQDTCRVNCLPGDPGSVPEPGTAGLLGLGLFGAALVRRLRPTF
ncbi:MAG: PEP-CTERM sorting domain-containing protein [Bryobacteraceae bacterium]